MVFERDIVTLIHALKASINQNEKAANIMEKAIRRVFHLLMPMKKGTLNYSS